MGIIRFLLAVAVVVAHSIPLWGNTMVPGQLAVQAFYIISGFYMALILTEKYNSYKLFITNRLLRLMPMYWFVLALALAYSLFILAVNKEHSAYLEPFFEHFGNFNWVSKIYIILTNLFVIGQDTVMFTGINLNTGNLYYTGNFSAGDPPLYNFLFVPQAWTISLEIMFYLIAPFLVKRKTYIIIGLILISLACRIILTWNGFDYDPWSYRFFPNELALFLIGILSYRLYKRIQNIPSFKISICLLSAIIVFTFTYQFIDTFIKYYLYLLLISTSIPFIFVNFKTFKWDTYIGELSYPIYISHLLIMVVVGFITTYFKFSLGKIWSFPIILICIAFSIFSIHLILKPIDKIRQRRLKKYNNG